MTSIGDGAFRGCSDLKSIVIPNSVTSIGYGAFYCCSDLNEIKVNWEKPLLVLEGMFDGVDISNCTLYVPKGTSALYMAAPVWIDFNNIQEFDAANIDAPSSSSLRLTAASGTVTISGADENDKVVVYSTSGALVKTARGNGRISLDAEGVYVIKVGSETFKVRM